MDVSRIRALRGPNLWSRHTAIEAIVACTDDECNIELMSGLLEDRRIWESPFSRPFSLRAAAWRS